MKRILSSVIAGFVLALLLVWAGVAAQAQSNAGTITGTVADKTGAVIPGAQIVATDQSSGVSRSTQSDERGVFSLVGIPVATYDVRVSASGFTTLLRKGIVVHINDQLELKSITLSVAGADTSVVVTATADEMIPTTSGESSYTISDTQMHNTNLSGRSAIELLGLIPGSGNTGNFTSSGYSSKQAGFGQNASTYTVNGTRFDQVQIVSDGATVTDLNNAGAASVTPNVEMVAELKVQSAAYGVSEPNGPIVVSTETKSGGRDYHGEGYISARHHSMNAADWQAKYNGLAKAQSSLFYPGFNIGGPVPFIKGDRDHKKLFFFLGSEYAQQHVDQGVLRGVVPTAAMREGDFSNAMNLDFSTSANNWAYWPIATDPCNQWLQDNGYVNCSNGKVVADSVGKALLNAMPTANADPTTHSGSNMVTDFTTSNPRNQEVLRMDYAINDNEHLNGRFNHENENVPNPYGPGNTWNMIPYTASQTTKSVSNSVNLTLASTITPTITNEASLSYTRFTSRVVLGDLSAVSTVSNPSANIFGSSADIIPNLQFGGSTDGRVSTSQLYLAGGEAPPHLGAQNTYTFNDAVTHLWRTHLIKAGFFAQIGRYNSYTTGNNNGYLYVDTYSSPSKKCWDSACSSSQDGNLYADLYAGYASGFSYSSENIEADMWAKRFDFFAQDTWQVNSKLSLNYGLRVDHIGRWYDGGGRIAVFNPSDYVSTSSYTDYTGMESHKTNSAIPISGSKALGFQFAPGLGFSYDLGHNSVIRGGAGIYYYLDPGTNAVSTIEAPPNFVVNTLYASSTPGYKVTEIASQSLSDVLPTVWGTADPKDKHLPVTYSWNLAVDHNFPAANKVELNYVGSASRHLSGFGVNNIVPAGSLTGPWYGTYYEQLARPYAKYGDIAVLEHNLNSNYNSLQLSVSRQKGWLNYWGSYTYGKTLAYNGEDAFDMKRFYGPTPFDRSQIVSFSYFINLPGISKFNSSAPAWAKRTLDGWKLSGIFQAMTGGPIVLAPYKGNEYAANRNVLNISGSHTIPAGYDSNGKMQYSTVSYNGDYVAGTPDEVAVAKLVAGCDPRKGLKKDQYFNPACFVAPSQLENGTFRLPYIHGPAFINDSLGLYKDFWIKGSQHLEIRGEVFNLFNHPWNEFIANDTNMYMSFSADGGATSSTSAGTIDNKTGHREIQLHAKYWF